MDSIIFRKAEIKDVNPLRHGIEGAFIPLLDKYYKNGYYPYFANIKWITDKIENQYVYVCEINGKVISGIIITKNPDETRLKLHTVYVDDNFRNKGIGYYIIKSAEQSHLNALEWKLETTADLKNNIHLYEKLGYKQYGAPKIVNENVTIVYYAKAGNVNGKTARNS